MHRGAEQTMGQSAIGGEFLEEAECDHEGCEWVRNRRIAPIEWARPTVSDGQVRHVKVVVLNCLGHTMRSELIALVESPCERP